MGAPPLLHVLATPDVAASNYATPSEMSNNLRKSLNSFRKVNKQLNKALSSPRDSFKGALQPHTPRKPRCGRSTELIADTLSAPSAGPEKKASSQQPLAGRVQQHAARQQQTEGERGTSGVRLLQQRPARAR